MRSRQLFAAILALLASGCVDLSAISTNELWIVNESNVAVSGIVCLDANRCFEYHLPVGKFVRTGMALCSGGSSVGISVEGDGLVGVPYQPLSHAVACDGLSAIRIRTDGAGTLIVSIDSEFSASELRPTGDSATDRN